MKGFVVFMLVLIGILVIMAGYRFYEKLRYDYNENIPIALMAAGGFIIAVGLMFYAQNRTNNILKFLLINEMIAHFMNLAR